MEQINYYLKFDCECKNYSHINCIDFNKYKKCLICKKDIKFNIFSNTETSIPTHTIYYEIFNNIMWLKLFMSFTKIDKCFDLLINLLREKKFMLLFVCMSFILTFGLIIELYIINVGLNIISIILNKFIEKLKNVLIT